MLLSFLSSFYKLKVLKVVAIFKNISTTLIKCVYINDHKNLLLNNNLLWFYIHCLTRVVTFNKHWWIVLYKMPWEYTVKICNGKTKYCVLMLKKWAFLHSDQMKRLLNLRFKIALKTTYMKRTCNTMAFLFVKQVMSIDDVLYIIFSRHINENQSQGQQLPVVSQPCTQGRISARYPDIILTPNEHTTKSFTWKRVCIYLIFWRFECFCEFIVFKNLVGPALLYIAI